MKTLDDWATEIEIEFFVKNDEIKPSETVEEFFEMIKEQTAIITMEYGLKLDLNKYIEQDIQVKIIMNAKYDINQGNLFVHRNHKFLVDFNTKGLLKDNEDYLIVQKLVRNLNINKNIIGEL